MNEHYVGFLTWRNLWIVQRERAYQALLACHRMLHPRTDIADPDEEC